MPYDIDYTDESLINLLKVGDRDAFKKIFDKYHFKIYHFVLGITKNETNTEDIVQNTFIHLWKYHSTLNTAYPLNTLLFKMSKQEIINWHRKFAKEFTTPDEIEIMDESAEYDNQQESQLIKINGLIECLPARRKKIIEMSKFEGKSYEEIAESMKMSTSAVGNQISKAMQHLKKNLSLW